jgi:hypothetical protein
MTAVGTDRVHGQEIRAVAALTTIVAEARLSAAEPLTGAHRLWFGQILLFKVATRSSANGNVNIGKSEGRVFGVLLVNGSASEKLDVCGAPLCSDAAKNIPCRDKIAFLSTRRRCHNHAVKGAILDINYPRTAVSRPCHSSLSVNSKQGGGPVLRTAG